MATVPKRFDRPTAKKAFVATKDYEKCLERAREACMVIVTGTSGFGKTWIAHQVLSTFCEENLNDSGMFKKLKCSSKISLEEDISELFCDYEVSMLPKTQPSWYILVHLYNELNKAYSDHLKYFIVDDTEAPDDLLDVLDVICSKLAKAGESISSKWKLIVTTTNTTIRKNRYRNIGKENIVSLEGFSVENAVELYRSEAREEDEGDRQSDNSIVGLLHKNLGGMPLALMVAIGEMDNQLMKPQKYVELYIKNLGLKAEQIQKEGRAARNSNCPSVIIAAWELAIQHCITDSPEPKLTKKLLRMMTFFNESDIPSELMRCCAETIMKPGLAEASVLQLMSRLRNRKLCTIRRGTDDSENKFFSVHGLIKQAMKAFCHGMDDGELLKNALVALTRVMPKDDRRHNPSLNRYYSNHGQSMLEAIDVVMPKINAPLRPLIKLLKCDLLISTGYCLVVHLNIVRSDDRFGQALDEYSQLVKEVSYKELTETTRSGTEKEAALILYEGGQSCSLVDSDAYLKFIGMLSEFHILNQKTLNKMADVNEKDLINRHLTARRLEELRNAKRVIAPILLAKVYMGELLAHIFFAWSKVYLHLCSENLQSETYVEKADAALAVYDRILKDHNIYLIQHLICERTRLKCTEVAVLSYGEAEELRNRWKELVPDSAMNRACYECGLVKCYLGDDLYHKLLCKEGELRSLGLLYKHTTEDCIAASREEWCANGIKLFEEIYALIKPEEGRPDDYNHSAMSMSYKCKAEFLNCCGEFDGAVKAILGSMEELRLENLPSTSMDPAHMRFNKLYINLGKYYNCYKRDKRPDSPDSPRLLSPTDREVGFLDRIIKAIKSQVTSDQPVENEYATYLEEIRNNDVQLPPLGEAETVPGVPGQHESEGVVNLDVA